MTDGISGSVLDRFLHFLTDQAHHIDLRILLYTARDSADEITQFRRLLDGADVDAFVLTSTFHGDPRTEWLIDKEQRFVTFGRPWGIDDMDDPAHLWVDVDGRSGVRQATAHFIASGARRIGYIGWPYGSGTGDDRRAGWLEEMEAAGRDPFGLDECADDSVGSGTDAMRRLLVRVPDVDAVVAASDGLALGALVASAGTIPIIGFDNTPVAASLGFSSVDQQLDAVAAGVLELLVGQHHGRARNTQADGEPRHRLIEPRLLLRTPTPVSE